LVHSSAARVIPSAAIFARLARAVWPRRRRCCSMRSVLWTTRSLFVAPGVLENLSPAQTIRSASTSSRSRLELPVLVRAAKAISSSRNRSAAKYSTVVQLIPTVIASIGTDLWLKLVPNATSRFCSRRPQRNTAPSDTAQTQIVVIVPTRKRSLNLLKEKRSHARRRRLHSNGQLRNGVVARPLGRAFLCAGMLDFHSSLAAIS